MGFVTLIDNFLRPGFVCFCIGFKRPFKITNNKHTQNLIINYHEKTIITSFDLRNGPRNGFLRRERGVSIS